MIKAYVNKTDVNVTTDGYMSTIAAESVQIVNFIYNAIAKEYGKDLANDYVDAVRNLVVSDEFAKKKERIANVDGDLIDISSIFTVRKKTGTNVPEQKNVPPMPEFLKKNPPL